MMARVSTSEVEFPRGYGMKKLGTAMVSVASQLRYEYRLQS